MMEARAAAASAEEPPLSVELSPGALPRIAFRPVPGHRHDETWQQRPVRAPPVTPTPSAGLAYFNNSKTAANSNVLQVILRDHGFARVESFEEAWTVFWCAGQVDVAALAKLRPHQKVNKFPRASALTIKANLWTHVKAQADAHGEAHFGFMPTTFVLPQQLGAFERHVRTMIASAPADEPDDAVWIFKPAAAYCGNGIWLHRVPREAADADGAADARASTAGGTVSVLTDAMHAHKGVVSRYIHPPFLLDGLKSDIRLYVLVTSFHPLTVYL
jgi:tubulin polyglutamylase TTLL5